MRDVDCEDHIPSVKLNFSSLLNASANQFDGCAMVELDVMKWVSNDFCSPYKARLPTIS